LSEARTAAREHDGRGQGAENREAGAENSAVLVAVVDTDTRLKLAPFRPLDESTASLPPGLHDSLIFRGGARALQLACILYAIVLLYWIWIAKDTGLAAFFNDPFFYAYSLCVTFYVAARFLIAPFYRPTPDTGYRPTCSIVIPSFNEEDCIEAAIDACLTSPYPADLIQVDVEEDEERMDDEHAPIKRVTVVVRYIPA